MCSCLLVVAVVITSVIPGEFYSGSHTSRLASVGPVFRIQLMLSPELIASAGEPDVQDRIRTKVNERLDMKDDLLKDAVRGISTSTSEDDADRVMRSVKNVIDRKVRETHEELKLSFPQEAFDRVIRIQLGLVGPVALSDPKIVDFLELSDAQQRRIKEMLKDVASNEREASVKSSSERSKFDDYYPVLTAEQVSIVKQAENDSKWFIGEESNRLNDSNRLRLERVDSPTRLKD